MLDRLETHPPFFVWRWADDAHLSKAFIGHLAKWGVHVHY